MNQSAKFEAAGSADPGRDVAKQLSDLKDCDSTELRLAWRQYYRVPLPKGLSRDMLIRAIAYKIQEHAFGGLSKSTLRRLATVTRTLDASAGQALDAYPSLKPGTKLVREWGGATYTVLVLDDGFEYLGQRYASLTRIAAVISGLHRSGPAFFGLKRTPVPFAGRSRAMTAEGAAHE